MSTRNIKIGLSDKDKLKMKNEIYDEVMEETNESFANLENEVRDDISEMHSTIQGLGNLEPSGTDTSANILAFTTNKGIYVATDTGGWYYWKADVNRYVYGGVYQATEIPDGSITPEKTTFQECKVGKNLFFVNDYYVNGEYSQYNVNIVDNLWTINIVSTTTNHWTKQIPLEIVSLNFEKGKTYTLTIYGIPKEFEYGKVVVRTNDRATTLIQVPLGIGSGTNGESYSKFTASENYENCKFDVILWKDKEPTTFSFKIQLEENITYTEWVKPEKTYYDKGTVQYIEKKYHNDLGNYDFKYLFELKNKYRYIVTTFDGNSNADGLILLGTNDLKTFDLVGKRGIFTASNGATVRDPSIIQIEEYYYLTYTICAFNQGNKIGFCKTRDFKTFEELESLAVYPADGITEFYQVWAPAWFREGNDIYIISAARPNSEVWFNQYISKYNPDTHTLENSYDTGIENIDGHLYKENGNYYIKSNFKNVRKSATLLGNYSKIDLTYPEELNNRSFEAYNIVKKDNGQLRMYFQEVAGAAQSDNSHQYYADLDTLESPVITYHKVEYTPKAEEYVRSINGNKIDREYYHWTIFDFNNINGNNNNFTD